VGLNEAVVSCTGKPISSENISFAQAILKELSSHLNSISEERGVRLRVSQRPSNGASSRLAALDVEEYGQATVSAQGSKGFLFYTDMPAIPLFEEVGLEERLEAEAKLQSFTPGGHFTNICMSDSVAKSEKLLEITRKAFDLGVSFFAYSRNHSICQNCGNTSIGCMTRCSKCGSEDITILARLSSTYLPLFDWPEERRRFLDRRMRYDFS
jgi:anaerobic ribonucleoside-triphosphate reductase